MSNKGPKARGLYTSQRDDTHQGAEAPSGAHMGVLVGPGEVMALPVGAVLLFVEDPRRADSIGQYVLEKVIYENHVLKEVRLIAYTKSTKSSRRLRLIASWEGQYVSALDEENAKAEAHANKAPEEPFVNPITGKKG